MTSKVDRILYICKFCNSDILDIPSVKRNFCSRLCYWNFLKTVSSNVKGKHWKMSNEARENIRKGHLGEKSYLWKGGYSKLKGYASFMEKRRERMKKINGGTHSFKEWLTLKAKYNNRCLNCNRSEIEVKITQDHIVPISKGGGDDIENIQPLCSSCNSSKKFKTIDYRYA